MHKDMTSENFVPWFRASAPYIHAFRGKTFVITFDNRVIDEGQFLRLCQDFNLLISLGIRLVLICATSTQWRDVRLSTKTEELLNFTVTDDEKLQKVIEEVGILRIYIESALSQSRRYSPMAGANISVVSGNFITAQASGVREGVDLQQSGQVRKIAALEIQRHLENGEIVLLPCLGYSPIGDIFSLFWGDVAVQTTLALKADKWLCLIDAQGIVADSGELVRELTADSAEILLKTRNQNQDEENFIKDPINIALLSASYGVKQGIPKVHLLSRYLNGGILHELFSHQGIGTLITQTENIKIRSAIMEDIPVLIGLTLPLEEKDILLRRTLTKWQKEISYFYVMEQDGSVIACSALIPYSEENMVEFSCFVVHEQYRGAGRGRQLLDFCVQQVKEKSWEKMFCLTTHLESWFEEYGFQEAGVEILPLKRRTDLDINRHAKVFVKNVSADSC